MDYADKYGVDYDEDFWLTDGYIIMNFTIETVDPDGRHRLELYQCRKPSEQRELFDVDHGGAAPPKKQL